MRLSATIGERCNRGMRVALLLSKVASNNLIEMDHKLMNHDGTNIYSGYSILRPSAMSKALNSVFLPCFFLSFIFVGKITPKLFRFVHRNIFKDCELLNDSMRIIF